MEPIGAVLMLVGLYIFLRLYHWWEHMKEGPKQ